ncbi:MAG: hypothetical protein HKUEN07_19200 [Rhodocyclaceae bacterium]|uniref:Lipoprotein n=1 Tax=Candidatus Desulfobacillus denitrificans TaxID=2608985 RepID=A0A809QZG6_9PROT|nr:hypothetical protein [Rhodocyclaceae bacterium]BBO20803.1 conserved hypothetical protein [Candidatus Desulfobacillus denitrificans]GIK44372.1 MAG: hypothetical protein BroJett012_02750 [Betaproteobacteria bacterium]GJQ55351.1 MAG: hypothetical protein HKUEN07_19200 [Rhodocyclaceae bacterium]
MRLLTLGFIFALAACGVSETATVAATAGAAKAKEAEQAKNAPAQVQGKLDEAMQQAERKREAAE